MADDIKRIADALERLAGVAERWEDKLRDVPCCPLCGGGHMLVSCPETVAHGRRWQNGWGKVE